MNDLDAYIQACRNSQPPTDSERRAAYNHRKYLEIRARDPDYYSRARRAERKARRLACATK